MGLGTSEKYEKESRTLEITKLYFTGGEMPGDIIFGYGTAGIKLRNKSDHCQIR
jgi:hypothetical protein